MALFWGVEVSRFGWEGAGVSMGEGRVQSRRTYIASVGESGRK